MFNLRFVFNFTDFRQKHDKKPIRFDFKLVNMLLAYFYERGHKIYGSN